MEHLKRTFIRNRTYRSEERNKLRNEGRVDFNSVKDKLNYFIYIPLTNKYIGWPLIPEQ
jgi:hypothetical protein